MVRRGLLLLVVAFVACSGRSKTDTPGNDGGGAGRSSSAGAGAAAGSEGAGRAGSAAIAGKGGSGGASSGAGGASGAGGTSMSGGSTQGGASGTTAAGAGSGGAGTGGESGSSSAGDGGAASECTEPNPEGCMEKGCPGGETCVMTSGRCIPSSCACGDGQWVCTEDCGGGVCVPAQCPEGCEASTETFCDEQGGVTWVCGASGGFDPSELLDSGCTDLGTQIPRYCCPATFKPECR